MNKATNVFCEDFFLSSTLFPFDLYLCANHYQKRITMESNDHNQAEIAGPVVFAVFLFSLVIMLIWIAS